MNADTLNWNVDSIVKKWDVAGLPGDLINPTEDELVAAGIAPTEVKEAKGNLLLNGGITRLLNLLTGGGGTAYNNANARIGVGTSNVTAAATQTNLQGTNFYKSVDATFPSVSAQTVTFRSTYGETEANFAWNEWAIDNGATAQERLNRKVVSLGTKSGGIWSLTVTITVT